MTDIVERLRGFGETGWPNEMREAADEIERLREQNAELLAALQLAIDGLGVIAGGDPNTCPHVGTARAAIEKAKS